MLAPVETVETVEAPVEIPAIPEIVKRLCNLGWIVVLERDSRGQIVTQLTAQGLVIVKILESQNTFEDIRKILRGWS